MKESYIYNFKAILHLRHILLFILCQGRWFLSSRAIWFVDRGGFNSEIPGVLCWLLFSVGIIFTQKTIQQCFHS